MHSLTVCRPELASEATATRLILDATRGNRAQESRLVGPASDQFVVLFMRRQDSDPFERKALLSKRGRLVAFAMVDQFDV